MTDTLLDKGFTAQQLSVAELLYKALVNRKPIAPPSRSGDWSIDDAYQISRAILQRRLADGEHLVGKKIGVTSKVVQEMLGVHQPDFGFLTDRMHYPNGADVSVEKSGLIQPRAEGEIAFILERDLQGPGITRDDVIAATRYVVPCFEIVDSRIENWEIAIEDTVADNASCGIFCLGEARVAPDDLDLAAVRLDMYCNGTLQSSGLGSAVQGHPAEAVAWLANTLGQFGVPLQAGEIILSGSLVPLLPVQAGDHIELAITGIGSASLRFSQ